VRSTFIRVRSPISFFIKPEMLLVSRLLSFIPPKVPLKCKFVELPPAERSLAELAVRLLAERESSNYLLADFAIFTSIGTSSFDF